MKYPTRQLMLAMLTACALAGGAGWAQEAKEMGRIEYQSSCASCHGFSGKGDGPMQGQLVKPPPDLTVLSRANGGTFPTQRLWETIDGRLGIDIAAHGGREMPIWGNVYRSRAGPNHPEWYVRNRINALLEYLASIQEP